ncbi:hypothetical protein CP_0985 [Chlamydia pneumoniae AR39]|uniref:Uncharacterized protein n=1 Tax=Chlamydia pneumoniae TaxID=83558 RepID=Q9K1U1_CHLPN|nr:hypothetical protein CP_0985 [Chlamydia pneumoniae AR39]
MAGFRLQSLQILYRRIGSLYLQKHDNKRSEDVLDIEKDRYQRALYSVHAELGGELREHRKLRYQKNIGLKVLPGGCSKKNASQSSNRAKEIGEGSLRGLLGHRFSKEASMKFPWL